jgi:hypothetical protein
MISLCSASHRHRIDTAQYLSPGCVALLDSSKEKGEGEEVQAKAQRLNEY